MPSGKSKGVTSTRRPDGVSVIHGSAEISAPARSWFATVHIDGCGSLRRLNPDKAKDLLAVLEVMLAHDPASVQGEEDRT